MTGHRRFDTLRRQRRFTVVNVSNDESYVCSFIEINYYAHAPVDHRLRVAVLSLTSVLTENAAFYQATPRRGNVHSVREKGNWKRLRFFPVKHRNVKSAHAYRDINNPTRQVLLGVYWRVSIEVVSTRTRSGGGQRLKSPAAVRRAPPVFGNSRGQPEIAHAAQHGSPLCGKVRSKQHLRRTKEIAPALILHRPKQTPNLKAFSATQPTFRPGASGSALGTTNGMRGLRP